MINDKLHVPKYIQLKLDIIEAIESGKLLPNERMYSRNELIRTYKVSDITVRKAIDELTAEGYVYSIQGKGTYIASRKTRHVTIGLVISHLHEVGDANRGYLDQSYMAPLVHTIEYETKKIGGRILLCLDNDSVSEERRNLTELIERQVDGILVVYIGGKENLDCLEEIKNANIPIVLIDRYTPDQETSYVISDSFKGAYKATEFLLKKNARSVHLLTCADEASTTVDRQNGFYKALDDFGFQGSTTRLTALSSNTELEEQSYIAASDLLKKSELPIGIFAVNSAIATGTWRCFKEARLEYSQFAISCFDRPPFAIPPDANIAWIQQPLEDMGRKSVQLLRSQMNGDPKLRKIVMEPHIHVY